MEISVLLFLVSVIPCSVSFDRNEKIFQLVMMTTHWKWTNNTLKFRPLNNALLFKGRIHGIESSFTKKISKNSIKWVMAFKTIVSYFLTIEFLTHSFGFFSRFYSTWRFQLKLPVLLCFSIHLNPGVWFLELYLNQMIRYFIIQYSIKDELKRALSTFTYSNWGQCTVNCWHTRAFH